MDADSVARLQASGVEASDEAADSGAGAAVRVVP